MKRLTVTALFSLFLTSNASFAKPVAMIVSGGENPNNNACDFYADVSDAKKVFKGWDENLFVADGPSPEGSPKPANATECVDGTLIPKFNRNGGRVLTRRDVPGSKRADLENLRASLKEQLKQLKPGEPVVFYFTDHGELGNVRLWRSGLSADELRDLMKLVPPQNKVIAVFDTCYGGSMLESAMDDGKASPNMCALSGTDPKEMATMGQSFMRFASESLDATDFSKVLHKMTMYNGMSSSPTSTSSLFLEKYAADHAPVSDSICATCLTDSTYISSLDSAAANIAKTSLANEIQQVQDEMQKSLSTFGLDPHATVAQVQAALAESEKKIKAADEHELETGNALSQAALGFTKAMMGKRYARLQALDTSLDSYRESRDRATDPKEQAAWEKKINAVMPEYESLSNEADHDKLQATIGSRAFVAYAKRTAGTEGHPWTADVYSNEDDAISQQDLTYKKNRAAKRLSSMVHRATALRQMVENNDVDAIQNYLRLQECESTSFRAS